MQFKQMFVTAVCVFFLLKLNNPSQRIFMRLLQLPYCDYSYYSEDSYYMYLYFFIT